jgi:Ca2+-binding RTX toxin-like protein
MLASKMLLQANSYALAAHGENIQISSSVTGAAVSGNSLANIIQGSAGADRIAALDGADILSGGAGNDRFIYAHASDSTGVNYDTISGFDAAADRLEFFTEVTGVDAQIKGALSSQSFEADLAAAANGASLAAHHAALFAPNMGALAGQVFLIVDANGVAGYQGGEDAVIRFRSATHMTSFGVADFLLGG